MAWSQLTTPDTPFRHHNLNSSRSSKTTASRFARRELSDAKRGNGSLNLDFLLYSLAGFDLSTVSKATLETLRLPSRLLTPFLVLMVLSYVTRRDEKSVLDRYFAKMNTPVLADPEADHQALQRAYASPAATEVRKLFPGSDWEFVRPTKKDLVGFFVSCFACFLIIGLLVWLAGIGA